MQKLLGDLITFSNSILPFGLTTLTHNSFFYFLIIKFIHLLKILEHLPLTDNHNAKHPSLTLLFIPSNQVSVLHNRDSENGNVSLSKDKVYYTIKLCLYDLDYPKVNILDGDKLPGKVILNANEACKECDI